MKKFFAVISLLLSVLALSAQDFKVTVNWDHPGAVRIGEGVMSDFVPVVLEDGQTSFTITEKKEYVVLAGEGFFISSVDKDGQNVYVGNSNEQGQFFSIGPYSSNNGKTFTVTTEKLVYEKSINVNVVNGEYYIAANLENSIEPSKSTKRVVPLVSGTQQVKLSQYDNTLTLTRKVSFTEKTFYSVRRGDRELESNSNFYPSYRMEDLQDGETITVTVRDPSIKIENSTVTLDINDKTALNSIRDWQRDSWIWPADISADWKLEIEKGQSLTFNFNEDYRIDAFLANSDSIAVDRETNVAKVTVNGDTRFTVKATKKVYEDVEMTIYTNNSEALIITDSFGYDAKVLDLGQGDPLEADIVLNTSPKEVIKAGEAMKYTVRVPSKKPKFFWAVKDGFYATKAWLCNPADPEYYIANGAVTAEEAPVWIDVRPIECSATAVIYYDGPDNTTKLAVFDNMGQNARPSESMTEYLSAGYNEIKFDPSYHASFRIRSLSSSIKENLYIYNNGVRVAEDKDSPGVFNTSLADSTALKVFMAIRAPKTFTATVETEDGASAEIFYDRLCRLSEASTGISSYGPTEVAVRPASGTYVLFDGREVAVPADGVFRTSAEAGSHSILLTTKASVKDLVSSGATSFTVVSLSGMTLLRNAGPEALAALQPGIYIINGKKTIIHN